MAANEGQPPPESSSFGDTLAHVRSILDDLETHNGIEVRPLRHAIDELEQHIENVAAIEQNIGAIRKEILDPVQKALDEGRTAGKFSVAGFWVGLGGVVISIGMGIYAQHNATIRGMPSAQRTGIVSPVVVPSRCEDLQADVRALIAAELGMNREYEPAPGELVLDKYEAGTILRSPDGDISILSWGTEEVEGQLCVELAVHRGHQKLGVAALRRLTHLVNESGQAAFRDSGQRPLRLCEGDTLRIAEHDLKVQSVRMVDPGSRPVGDKDDAAVFTVKPHGE